jgi:hypothetical protein
VESNGGQIHYVEGLKKFLTERYSDEGWKDGAQTQTLLLPRDINNSVQKEQRISMLEPYLDNFTLQLREEMSKKFRNLNNELEDWPNSEFDDCLDSLSGCFFTAFKTFKLQYLYLAGS